MEKLRVGVVGVGYMGRLHAQKYSLLKNVKLVGVVDINISRAAEIADEFSTLCYKSYEELFGKINVVSIATPIKTHFEIAKRCLMENIHVFLEKPISENIEQADELINISEDAGLILQVGHIEQFNPAIVSIRKKINKLLFFKSNRLSIFKSRGAEVSVVLDLMIHDLEILLSFIDSDIEDVFAIGKSVVSNKIDVAEAFITFVNGVTANIMASRVNDRNQRKIVLLQKNICFQLDLAVHEVFMLHQERSKRNNFRHRMIVEKISVSKNDQLEEQLKSFIDSIRTLRCPTVSGLVSRNALELALIIEETIGYDLLRGV